VDGEILQFLLDRPDTEPVRYRSENLHAFERGISLLLRRLEPDGAHIVQAVRQFDDDDADIVRHRDQHFTNVFGLLFLAGGIRNSSQFGQPVHKGSNFAAEFLFNLLKRNVGILHHIMQQGSHDRFRIHSQLRHNGCDRERMNDIRLAGLTELSGMFFLCQLICHFNAFHIERTVAGFQSFLQNGALFRNLLLLLGFRLLLNFVCHGVGLPFPNGTIVCAAF